MRASEYIKNYGLICANMRIAEMEHTKNFNEFYFDLKRLIESHELVESFNGLEMAKKFYDENIIECIDAWNLKQAIADVESCQ